MVVAALALAAAAEGAVEAPQAPRQAPSALAPGDSAALQRDARAAQARFERGRVQHLPMSWGGGGMECDEVIGRMCIRFGRGSDWEPPPEAEEILTARDGLLETLEEIGREIAGDDWVLGQRVQYLGKAGRWDEAERLARTCGATPWWCSALLGYVLHHEERFPESARAFDDALEAMDPEQADEWRDLELLMDRDGRDLLRRHEGAERRDLEERIWTLANPLVMIPGNDRRTEHFSRHVASRLRVDARNPYNLRWGSDLAQITVRYGVEYGWERERPRWRDVGPPRVLGRFHPRSRGFLPPGKHLGEPAALPPGEWRTDERRVRARHAPPYAPRVHSMEPQVALFRRGDSVHVIAAWEVPPSQDHEGADWEPPPEGAYRSGLFLIPVAPWPAPASDASASSQDSSPWTERWSTADIREGEGMPSRTAGTGSHGFLRTTAPHGEYVLSLETWHPGERKAWRARQGIRQEALPRGVIALSSLMLVRPMEDESVPALGELASRALPSAEVREGGSVGVVWEVYGLEPHERSLRFRVTVERDDRGLLRRAGEWLRVLEPEPPVVVTWSEPGPEWTGPFLRAVNLDLEALPPGEYRLRLELDPPGRTPVTAERAVRIVEGGS
jgi:hypothetical protein